MLCVRGVRYVPLRAAPKVCSTTPGSLQGRCGAWVHSCMDEEETARHSRADAAHPPSPGQPAPHSAPPAWPPPSPAAPPTREPCPGRGLPAGWAWALPLRCPPAVPRAGECSAAQRGWLASALQVAFLVRRLQRHQDIHLAKSLLQAGKHGGAAAASAATVGGSRRRVAATAGSEGG